MSCSHSARVGDRGQRFEVRYHKAVRREESPGVEVVSAGEEAVFGWAATLDGARQMRDGWKQAPSVFDAWVVDRHALTARGLAAVLLMLPAEDQERIVVALAIDGSDDDGDGTAYDNITNVGRTPDGRIVLD